MIRIRATLVAISAPAVLFCAAKVAQAQLRIDVDDRGAPDPLNTEVGFDQFLMDGNENDDLMDATTRTFGDLDVTIAHSNGGGYGDRRRTDPTNLDAFDEQELLRDFIFARGATIDDGLDITIENLMPEAAYEVRIWSFDTGSTPTRTSDWSANGVLVVDDYSFDGGVVPPDPADNDVYAFDFTTIADSSGTVLIEGRWQSGPCCGVFLNAMSVDLQEDILVGDFTGDGVINVEDFDRLADNMYGHLDGVSGHENGDINFDDRIDLADFHQFVESFPEVRAAALGVPEPASWLIVMLATVGLITNRCRRRLR